MDLGFEGGFELVTTIDFTNSRLIPSNTAWALSNVDSWTDYEIYPL